MTRAVQARIDLSALHSNFSRVREVALGRKIMVVVKANAYGHGALHVAQALADADSFGVASVEEALVLRRGGVAHPVVLLEGFFDADELSVIAHEQFEVVIHHVSQLKILEAVTLKTSLTVWLKIDSGMHRLGFPPEQLQSVWRRLSRSENVNGNIRLMSHLACADDQANTVTIQQLELFNLISKSIKAEKSIANSAGILGWPSTHMDWVRPGIMLYGASPLMGKSANQLGLKPVMTLCSRLIAVNQYKKGERIGYGGMWSCPEDMQVGVVAVGYGDGYPRHAAIGTPVLVNGDQASLVGRVSMDMITIDLRSIKNARVGDLVVLWGDGLSVDEIAERAETISYELLCGISPRVSLQIVDDINN